MKLLKEYWTVALSSLMLAIGLVDEWGIVAFSWSPLLKFLWYLVSILPVGVPIVKEMFEEWSEGGIFNEFFLMVAAAVSAFIIGEYPEGLAVLLFYTVGEKMQDAAVDKAHDEIESLLNVCPSVAAVFRDGIVVEVDPATVAVGETVLVKAGGRVPLDGVLLSESASFDTSAITGESAPRTVECGDEVLSGMISTAEAVQIKVNKPFVDSTMNRILDMVESANDRKSNTELFIRKFARYYTAIVVVLVFLVNVLPLVASVMGWIDNYSWRDWLGKSAVFMVISCPCALLVSIPLGYFGGIGAASRHGILVKGGNYLDALYDLKAVAFDKTGTLTQGHFRVSQVLTSDGISDKKLVWAMATAERLSSHPMAKAICKFADENAVPYNPAESVKEVAGRGLKTVVDGTEILVGSAKLLLEDGVVVPDEDVNRDGSIVFCSISRQYAGCVVLVDEPKPEARKMVQGLNAVGIDELHVLSGDRQIQVQTLAAEIGIAHAYGDLLPQDKVAHVDALRQRMPVAFVGDGINDAPVLALANVGIAMGAMGSDVAVESADVIIEDDNPAKVATAVSIAKNTRSVVWQNVSLALGVKVAVMILALLGLANMWMGVFADSGVALLAVLNAVRIQRKSFGDVADAPSGGHRHMHHEHGCSCCHHHHDEHHHQ